MKNKVLATFLSLIMALALLPAVAFAAQSYKITFHVEGEGYVYARNYGTNLTDGSFVMVEEGQRVILYAMANSKDYKMKTATAEGATLTWGGSATRTLDMPGNNVDVYFTFGPANYKTVYFDANGGTGVMSPVEDADDSYVLPECTFTAPEGKEFAGWSKSPEGPAFTNQVMGLTSDPTTLYAIWKDKAPTHMVKIKVLGQGGVSIRANGKALPGPFRDGAYVTIETGKSVAVYATPDGDDYEYRTMTCDGAYMEWAGSAARSFTMPDMDVTVRVTFCDRSKFVVTFDANGGSGTMAPEVDATSPFVLPPRPLFVAPAGKEFDGWSRTPNGPVLTFDTISLTEDTTLYAIWKDRTFWLEEYAPGIYMICKRGSYTGNTVPQYAIPINNRPSTMRVPLFYVPDYDAWCLLTTDRSSLSARYFFEKDMGSPEAKRALMVPKPGFESYGLVGDANGNGSVNVVDAQIAYDIATGVYKTVVSSGEGTGTMTWLIADVNGDHHVDAADALAIQHRAVHGAWA